MDHDQHSSSVNQREIGSVGIVAMYHKPEETRNMLDQDRMHQLTLSRSGSLHQVVCQPRSPALHQMRMGNEHQLALSQSGQTMVHQLALSRSGQAMAHQLALSRSGQAKAHQLTLSRSGGPWCIKSAIAMFTQVRFIITMNQMDTKSL
ncbi:hypothetical protein TanjilG_28642 [Lupinus angustifolius]|uniref:Uncharacterized protein n=1 Tax=Lupinus angustifolius TaxID=3871 RepID=A0A4P1RPU8_LUPAN|nr:hypothetical protein TanjilG_28642 [Lupinus angustifolius]